MIYGGWKHCNLVRLKADCTGLLPFEDGTIYKEITPEGYVEGPVFLYAMENIILCGLKVVGAAPTTGWPMR